MNGKEQKNKYHLGMPLAARIRPTKLADFLGQEEVIGKGRMLSAAIARDELPSMILWGPPGSGKTTLAHIIAGQTKADFHEISAVTSGKKDLVDIIERASESARLGQRTILFIDEIHRWNKAQQDALLPHVERGTIILIGATTENPSFEVIAALLSRCRVFVLRQLTHEQIEKIVRRALSDKERGLGNLNIKITDEVMATMAKMSNGDARAALNALEYVASTRVFRTPQSRGSETAPLKEGSSDIAVNLEMIKEAFQRSHLMYDKNGEEHYNIISALHKSMRGSDGDAALYWLGRMVEAGEDPLYIARRLIRFAAEDIGIANSNALVLAVAAYNACHFIGLPECNVVLAEAVVYMAKCKKSNELYAAYGMAAADVKEFGNLGVPLHLRNAPTKLMRDLDYGKGYKYSPNFGYEETQEYMPEELKGKKYLK